MDERLIDFYNRRFEALSQLDFELDPNCISVTDFHADTSVKIDFRRTARVPDDGETYKAPPPLSVFPLFSSRHYQQRLPEQMRKKGDIFFPMLQRETFTIGFQAKTDNNQFAIRVLTGSVNVITGNSAKHENSSDEQDYIVVPQQSVLSGFKSGANVMKQFVTMPMGSEYTVEKQVTGEEYIGGVQFEIIPRLRQSVVFTRAPASQDEPLDSENRLDLLSTPRQLGLQTGAKVWMADFKPWKLYNLQDSNLTWAKDLAYEELEEDDGAQKHRLAYVRDLYQGPRLENFDLSSSLLITAIPVKHMYLGPSQGDEVWFRFKCPTTATTTSIMSLLLKATGEFNSRWKAQLTLARKEYFYGDNVPIAQLNLGVLEKTVLKILPPIMLPPVTYGGGASAEQKKTVDGWDLGVGIGGQVESVLHPDTVKQLWNWTAARLINVQILNAITFEAVTGLCSPLSPISFDRHLFQEAPLAIEEPRAVPTEVYQTLRSVGAIDFDKRTKKDVTFDKGKEIICVCCETSRCDSV